MSYYFEWEQTVFPKLSAEAYKEGQEAKLRGLPDICNLTNEFCYNGTPLKIFKECWQSGYNSMKLTKEINNG